MRMGITERKRSSRSSIKKEPVLKPKNKPSDISDNSVPSSLLTVGRISYNLIDTIYIPIITRIADRQSEQYAASLLEYEESLKQQEKLNSDSNDTDADADADLDGILETEPTEEKEPTEPIPPIPKPSISSLLFASTFHREEIQSQILTPTALHFTTPLTSKRGTPSPQWKIHANAAKFERHLDEKYGRFRPFITQHPEVEQFLRTTQRRIAKGEIGSPFRQGDPPMDVKASIILLFLLHRNGVRWEVMGLSVLFLLVGLQPWALVFAVAVGRWVIGRRRKKMGAGWLLTKKEEIKVVKPYYAKVTRNIGDRRERGIGDFYRDTIKKAKHDYLLRPVGEPIATTKDAADAADYLTDAAVTNKKGQHD